MPIVFHHLKRLYTVCIIVLSCVLIAPKVFAIDCPLAYEPLLEKVSDYSSQLQTISSRTAYSEHVKTRYIVLEDILEKSLYCAKKTRLSHEQRTQWQAMKDVIVLLQSSAKKSAFTDFEDWLAAKSTDISHYQRFQASL